MRFLRVYMTGGCLAVYVSEFYNRNWFEILSYSPIRVDVINSSPWHITKVEPSIEIFTLKLIYIENFMSFGESGRNYNALEIQFFWNCCCREIVSKMALESWLVVYTPPHPDTWYKHLHLAPTEYYNIIKFWKITHSLFQATNLYLIRVRYFAIFSRSWRVL